MDMATLNDMLKELEDLVAWEKRVSRVAPPQRTEKAYGGKIQCSL